MHAATSCSVQRWMLQITVMLLQQSVLSPLFQRADYVSRNIDFAVFFCIIPRPCCVLVASFERLSNSRFLISRSIAHLRSVPRD